MGWLEAGGAWREDGREEGGRQEEGWVNGSSDAVGDAYPVRGRGCCLVDSALCQSCWPLEIKVMNQMS